MRIKLLTSIRLSLVVENDRAPLHSLRSLLSNLSSSLRQSSRDRSRNMTMGRLEKHTFSRPVKVTMPRVAEMGDRLTPDRDKTGNRTQELRKPRLTYKTQY